MKNADWIHVYVVFRIDHYRIGSTGEVNNDSVTIKEVFLTSDEAIKEVERLNSLKEERDIARQITLEDSRKITYHFQSAKFYPRGRKLLESSFEN